MLFARNSFREIRAGFKLVPMMNTGNLDILWYQEPLAKLRRKPRTGPKYLAAIEREEREWEQRQGFQLQDCYMVDWGENP